jgi:hypothetical protein
MSTVHQCINYYPINPTTIIWRQWNFRLELLCRITLTRGGGKSNDEKNPIQLFKMGREQYVYFFNHFLLLFMNQFLFRRVEKSQKKNLKEVNFASISETHTKYKKISYWNLIICFIHELNNGNVCAIVRLLLAFLFDNRDLACVVPPDVTGVVLLQTTTLNLNSHNGCSTTQNSSSTWNVFYFFLVIRTKIFVEIYLVTSTRQHLLHTSLFAPKSIKYRLILN